MNIRNATLAMRKRKTETFEQERAASQDYDTQREGGTPSKSKKKDESGSKTAKKISKPGQ